VGIDDGIDRGPVHPDDPNDSCVFGDVVGERNDRIEGLVQLTKHLSQKISRPGDEPVESLVVDLLQVGRLLESGASGVRGREFAIDGGDHFRDRLTQALQFAPMCGKVAEIADFVFQPRGSFEPRKIEVGVEVEDDLVLTRIPPEGFCRLRVH
jgi:hypothetical protein